MLYFCSNWGYVSYTLSPRVHRNLSFLIDLRFSSLSRTLDCEERTSMAFCPILWFSEHSKATIKFKNQKNTKYFCQWWKIIITANVWLLRGTLLQFGLIHSYFPCFKVGSLAIMLLNRMFKLAIYSHHCDQLFTIVNN